MHDIPELDRKGLRQFALTFAAIVATVFGLILPFLLDAAYPLWPWLIAGAFTLWGLAAPDSVAPFYRLWMRFGGIMGNIINRIILGTVFFLIIWPIGAIMRLTGKDPMARTWDPNLESYRIPSAPLKSNHMERPY